MHTRTTGRAFSPRQEVPLGFTAQKCGSGLPFRRTLVACQQGDKRFAKKEEEGVKALVGSSNESVRAFRRSVAEGLEGL
jgi:hypothetical protein